MDHIVEFVQGILLVLIALLWYLAKRDLTAVAIQKQAPALEELKDLRATIEQLIEVLEDRATSAEKQLDEAETRVEEAQARLDDARIRLSALIEEANELKRASLIASPPPHLVIVEEPADDDAELDAVDDAEADEPSENSADRLTVVTTALDAVAAAQIALAASEDETPSETVETVAPAPEEPIAPKPKSRARAERKAAAEPAAKIAPVAPSAPVVKEERAAKPAPPANAASTAAPAPAPAPAAKEEPPTKPAPDETKTPADPYAKVYELVDQGVTDRTEIARRTGFGVSEIDLVLTMRPRTAPPNNAAASRDDKESTSLL
ncbi:MAG: hypothetical protein P4L33_21590 [Capsulimonadaceae bacterium]|nr:hypothetical protein [Capsulimonadaceae bacterium]